MQNCWSSEILFSCAFDQILTRVPVVIQHNHHRDPRMDFPCARAASPSLTRRAHRSRARRVEEWGGNNARGGRGARTMEARRAGLSHAPRRGCSVQACSARQRRPCSAMEERASTEPTKEFCLQYVARAHGAHDHALMRVALPPNSLGESSAARGGVFLTQTSPESKGLVVHRPLTCTCRKAA